MRRSILFSAFVIILALASMGPVAIHIPADLPMIQTETASDRDTGFVADGHWSHAEDFGTSDIRIVFHHGPYQRWVARYNGPGNGYDGAKAIALNADGNIYVTGESAGDGTRSDYATVKYDTNGNELWIARYGPGEYDDAARAIVVDAAGNVYVTGNSYADGTGDDYATIMYDANGNELWVARYNGPGSAADHAYAIAIDADGDIYVTGASWGSGTEDDYATIKYDGEGNIQWVARYDGPGDMDSMDFPTAVAIDATGNVYVTGLSEGMSGYDSNYDYATVKYDTNGNELWVARYGPGEYDDAARAIAVDAAGNVYVTGNSYADGTGDDYATIKYDAQGNEQWVARYSGSGYGYDSGTAIVLLQTAVYVTGLTHNNESGDDYTTIKYDANGNELWVARYNGPGDFWDVATAIALDTDGGVYVTGYSWDATKTDRATIRYDTNGNELWVARDNNPGQGNTIALDADGNIYVTGESMGGSATGVDYTTIKYSTNPPAETAPVRW